MKKTLLTFTVASFLGLGVTNAQLFLSQNFNTSVAPTLPTGWASSVSGGWVTSDPATIAPYFAAVGLTVTEPAHASAVGINGNTTGNNGAVLSSPAFTPASGAMLMFDKAYFKFHLSADATKVETLTFVVSTNGGTLWTDVSEIAANSSSGDTWQSNSIDLSAYAGQSIKVGFRYNNTSSALVGALLDNIRVILGTDMAVTGVSGTGGHQALGNIYATPGTSINIASALQNNGTSSATAATMYQATGAPVSGTVSPASVASGATATASYSTPFTVPAAGTATAIKVWVSAPGDLDHSNDTMMLNVVSVASIPAKKMVFEEGTSTSCVWCPRGTINMEDFAAAHPGAAAQIAVHQPLDYNDPMQIAAYYAFTGPLGGGGIPNVVLDRTSYDDPSNMEAQFATYSNNFGFADFTLGTPTVSGGTATVPFTIVPSVNIANPKVLLVVTESDVTIPAGVTQGTANWWAQSNAYAQGSGNGTMGGFELQPNPVAANLMHYNFVARVLSPSTPGGAAPAGLPTTLVAGTTYNSTLSASLNASWNTANLQYIVMLIDGTTGDVMNSAFSALPTLVNPIGTTTAVVNVAAGINKATLYPNPTVEKAYLEMDLNNATSGTLTITDATGRTVSSLGTKQLHSGNNVIEIPTTSLSNGLYFVNFAAEKGNISLKLQVIK